MGSAASIPTPDTVVSGEIIILNPAEIEIGERLREIDRVHAEAVGWSMVKDGQVHPIEVCRLPGHTGWHLAGPGGHRLTGALIVGMNGIEAREVSASRTSRRRREAVENLFRRQLDPIDRAATIAELVLLKRQEAGLVEAASRDAKVKSHLKREVTAEAGEIMETISMIYGWSDELGAELGFTGRTIRNDLMLYRGLRPSLVSQLRAARHPVLSNASQLRALAKLEPRIQGEVVDALVGANGWEPCRTVTEAVKRTQPEKGVRRDDNKLLSTFASAFQRMSVAERKGALDYIKDLIPAGTIICADTPDQTRYRDEALEAIDEARDVIDGIYEDELLPVDRASDLDRVGRRLQRTRLTIAGDGFALERAS